MCEVQIPLQQAAQELYSQNITLYLLRLAIKGISALEDITFEHVTFFSICSLSLDPSSLQQYKMELLATSNTWGPALRS